MAYEVFGRFYDDVMGDRAGPTKLLRNMIREACPDARTVLELACGAGSVLKHLQEDYAVAGLDSSRRMLSIARRKLPGVRLVRQDMTDFSMSRRFDVICCVYDSINHLTRFSDWQKVFARVRQHLLPDGCFIFDMNTKRKLDRHIAEPPWVHWFGKNLLIMDVRAVGTLGSNWNIVVFERLPDGRYARHEENIAEFAFPASKVVSALRREFARVRVIDTGRKRPSKRSEKLFFVCQ